MINFDIMKRSDVMTLIEDVLVDLEHIYYGEISEELSLDELQVDAEDRLYLVTKLNKNYFCFQPYCLSWVNLFRFHKVKDVIDEVMSFMN